MCDNNSERAAPTYVIPKKNGTVRFIYDFRELNKKLKENHSHSYNTGFTFFKYTSSLDINMGNHHIELFSFSRKPCTIVLP